MSDHDEAYSLLLPFDSDDPRFVRGFEAGRLWEQVKALAEDDHFEQTVHVENGEMALRIFEAVGGVEFRAEPEDGWLHLTVWRGARPETKEAGT